MDMMLSGHQAYGARHLPSGTGDLVTTGTAPWSPLPPARGCCWARGLLVPAEEGARQLELSQEAVGPTGERAQQGGGAAGPVPVPGPSRGAPAGQDAEGGPCRGAVLAELEDGSCHGAGPFTEGGSCHGGGPPVEAEGGSCHGGGPPVEAEGGSRHGDGPLVEAEGGYCHGDGPPVEAEDWSCHGGGPPVEAEGGSCHGDGPPVELEGVPHHGDNQENGPIDGAGLTVEKGRGFPDGAGPRVEEGDGPCRGASRETEAEGGAGHTVEMQCEPCHGAGRRGTPRDDGDGVGKDGASTEATELQRRQCVHRRTQAGEESAMEMRGVLETHRHGSRELSGPISVAPTRPVTTAMDAIDGRAYGSCPTSVAPKSPVTMAIGTMEDRAYGSGRTSAAPTSLVTTATAAIDCGSWEFSGPTSVAATSPVTTTTAAVEGRAPGPGVGPEETDDDFGTFEQAGNLVVWAVAAGPVWLEDEDRLGGSGNREDEAQHGTWTPWPEELAETVQHRASHGFSDGAVESWESKCPHGSPGPTSSGAWQPFQRGSPDSGFGASPLSERQGARCGLGQPWWAAGTPERATFPTEQSSESTRGRGDVETMLRSCFPTVLANGSTGDACRTLECMLGGTETAGHEGSARGRARELWATLRDVDEAVGLKQRAGCRSHGLLLAALRVDPADTVGGSTALDSTPLAARQTRLEPHPSPITSGRESQDLTLIKDSLPQHQVNGLSPSHRLQAFFQHWAQADRNGRNKTAYDVNKNYMA